MGLPVKVRVLSPAPALRRTCQNGERIARLARHMEDALNITVKPEETKDGILTVQVTVPAADVDAT